MPLMTIRVAHFSFSPHWISTIATLLLLPLLLALGNWQLHRAAQKKELQSAYAARNQIAPLQLNQLTKLPADMQYYPVQMTGHFDNQQQFLLDNQFYQHQVGYYVITPFILAGSHKVVLLNRGWVTQGNNRQQLPVLTPVTGTVTLQGIIRPIDNKGFVLGNNIEDHVWPKRIGKIDQATMSQLTGYEFYPFVVLLNGDQPHGFARAWEPINLNPAKHYGYAFQWFALAATLFIIYILVNTQRKGAAHAKH